MPLKSLADCSKFLEENMIHENYQLMCDRAVHYDDFVHLMDGKLKEPTSLILRLFNMAFPQFKCCRCSKQIKVCESCKGKIDYVSQFGTIQELILVAFMNEKYDLTWDHKEKEWVKQ